MNLHENMLNDLDQVFFSLDEFACVHNFNGTALPCVVDDSENLAQTGADSGFENGAGIGLLAGRRVVYCKACDLVPQPLPGEKAEMDGKYWIVGDGISETEGMLIIPLERAY